MTAFVSEQSGVFTFMREPTTVSEICVYLLAPCVKEKERDHMASFEPS